MSSITLSPLGMPLLLWPLASFASYVLWILVYRYFLSPLKKVPGPKLAGITYWYECYYGMKTSDYRFLQRDSHRVIDVVHPAQFVFKIKELHEKYGMQKPPAKYAVPALLINLFRACCPHWTKRCVNFGP